MRRLIKESKTFAVSLGDGCIGTMTPIDGFATMRDTAAMLIYKIFRADEWAHLQAKGETAGAPIDVQDGYVHFSTAEQAAETAEKYFAGVADLWLITVDADALGADLKWEPSRGGALFPHLYRALRMTDVTGATALPVNRTATDFPSLT